MSSPYVLPTKSKKDMHEVAKGAIKHSFLVEEQAAFVEHVNSCLGNDAYLKEHGYLPIRPDTDDLYKAMADGIMLWCVLRSIAGMKAYVMRCTCVFAIPSHAQSKSLCVPRLSAAS